MLKWEEYIDHLLSETTGFDDFQLEINGKNVFDRIPPLVKCSIQILDSMLVQGKNNIIVFPEANVSVFTFMLAKLLHNIAEGKIKNTYDISSFQMGQKLSFMGNIVEYKGICTTANGQKRVKFRTSDCDTSFPLEILPLFQKVESKRLSKAARLSASIQEWQKTNENESKLGFLELIKDYQTHMDSSICCVLPVLRTSDLLLKSTIFGTKLTDILLIGKASNYEEPTILGSGQRTGTPSFIICPDLYTVKNYLSKGEKIQSIIVDASSVNIENELIHLSEIQKRDIPIAILADTVNSFNFNPLIDRGFKVWRWDSSSLTESLIDDHDYMGIRKNTICVHGTVEYPLIDDEYINIAAKRVLPYKKDAQEMDSEQEHVYASLASFIFKAFSTVSNPSDSVIDEVSSSLSSVKDSLDGQMPFVSKKFYDDMNSAIDLISKFFSQDCNNKVKLISNLAKEYKQNKITLVIPNNFELTHVQQFWDAYSETVLSLPHSIKVIPLKEYLSSGRYYHTVIISGWINSDAMKKIIFGYRADRIVILLYQYERKWSSSNSRKWNYEIEKTDNTRTIIDTCFRLKGSKIIANPPKQNVIPALMEQISTDDSTEIDDVQLILTRSRFRRYMSEPTSGTKVIAIPISFFGDLFGFYNPTHKMVSVSKIINGESPKPDVIHASEVRAGDYLATRETDKNIIKELADTMLRRNGMQTDREVSKYWKNWLNTLNNKVGSQKNTADYLKKNGCKIEKPSILNWFNEDIISPRSIEDLELLEKLSGDGFSLYDSKTIFSAAKHVREAHQNAGHEIGKRLQKYVADKLSHASLEQGDIDDQIIEFEIKGVGLVKVLQVVSIDEAIEVDATNTNKLMKEKEII